jgi:hypothetical protein
MDHHAHLAQFTMHTGISMPLEQQQPAMRSHHIFPSQKQPGSARDAKVHDP